VRVSAGVRKADGGFNMKDLKNRKTLFAVMMLLALFAGCKGEDPTAPPPSSGPGTGSGTPPVGASITLTVANPNPLANSSTTITARVTVGGQPVPNGTAVEFGSSPIGLFADTGANTTIKTTTNGEAVATLGSSSAGTANVTVVVNNAVARTTVTFQTSGPVVPPTDTTVPVINSVTPSVGRPEGGELITIAGRNFRPPVRVFFDVGGGRLIEGQVASVTSTQVQVLTPRVDLGAGQTLAASVVLINEAGTPSETRVTAAAAFTFRRVILTPIVVTMSPDSGPVGGGTRITIFGEGFESPVQVSFAPGASAGGQGWHQIEVINVTFNQIIALTPPARDVNPTGSGILTGPVDMRIVNINSGTEVVAPVVFRYIASMQITGVRPLAGTALGGTDVTIDGLGFVPPVDVFIAGAMAQTLRVSGSQILARTSGLASPCSNASGPVRVVNIDNGDSATSGSTFGYIGVVPVITSITSGGPIVPGSTITVNVLDPGVGPLGTGIARFTINGVNVSPTPLVIVAGTGTQPFTMVVPATGFNFPTIPCITAALTPGSQLGTVNVTVIFTNVTTACTATLDNGLTVLPPPPNTCLTPPTAIVTPLAPTCASAGSIVAAGAVTGTTTINIANAPASQPLTVSNPTVTCNNATCTIAPLGVTTVPAGTSANWTVTVDPTAAGAVTGTATFTTNDPNQGSITVCITATGT